MDPARCLPRPTTSTLIFRWKPSGNPHTFLVMNELSYGDGGVANDLGSLRLHVELTKQAQARLNDEAEGRPVWGPAMPVDARTAFVSVRGLG